MAAPNFFAHQIVAAHLDDKSSACTGQKKIFFSFELHDAKATQWCRA
jgi:hypothetical protein